MPEGPEIHRAAAQLRKALVGRTLLSVGGEHTAVAGRLDGWVGREVDAVEARSKAMLIHVGEQVLYSHNQLYGRWTVNRATTAPRNWKRSLRVELVNDQHACRLWSASDVMLMDAWEVNGHPYIAQLGPDVADLRTTVAEVRVHLEEARFQRRGLAGLLLDQRFLAGVGNYLRSEILFQAGVDPSRRLGHLNAAEKDALAEAAVAITHRAYHQRGSRWTRTPTTQCAVLAWRGAARGTLCSTGTGCPATAANPPSSTEGSVDEGSMPAPPAKPEPNVLKVRVLRPRRTRAANRGSSRPPRSAASRRGPREAPPPLPQGARARR